MSGQGRSHAMTPRISLRLRLTLWMLAISVVIQGTVATLLLMYQRQALQEFYNDRLSMRAQTVVASVRDAGFHVTDADFEGITAKRFQVILYERFVVSLYDKDGSVLASSSPRGSAADAAGLLQKLNAAGSFVGRAAIPAFVSTENPSGWGRMFVQRLRAADGTQYMLLFAATDSRYEAMMRLSVMSIWISVPTGAFATAVAGWLIGGLALAPLRQLARVASSLSPDNIEQDIEAVTGPPEIAALERDLQETRSKLRQAFHAQDRFISTVAHELKTPIAVILTEVETLPKNNLAAAEKVVKSAAEEMERLGRMVESFLTLTKVRGGQALTHPEPCNVNELVTDAVASCGVMAKQYGVLLSPELTDRYPPIKVSGECPLLTTMMDNLLRNAIRFSPAGKVIAIRVRDVDKECVVAVRDFGPGIPPELLDKLFDRFVQGPSGGERGRGHGLGLTIAQGIAELHGGRISVRNIPEGGCEFTVRLPLLKRSA